MDEAVLQALHDFYRDAAPLIATATSQARAHHRDSNTDRHAELDAIEAAITAKTTARDEYRTAFENGTMDEEDTGPRLRELRTEIEALKVRRDEITDLISDEPVAPSPSTLAKTRARLEDVITNSDSAERKAIIEELIAEIRIIGDEIIPVFRLPRDEPVAVDAATPATSTGDGNGNGNEPDPVRAMPNLVGRAGLEPATEGL
jgi:site-specific DNA recombinase